MSSSWTIWSFEHFPLGKQVRAFEGCPNHSAVITVGATL